MDVKELGKLVWKHRSGKWAVLYLCFFAGTGLFSDFLANERPLVYKDQGKWNFPIARQLAAAIGLAQEDGKYIQQGWAGQKFEWAILPPVPYSAETIDRKNLGAKSPFGPQRVQTKRYWHWLGTDQAGHDVAAGLIHGTRVALLIGLIGMLTATLIGVFLGGIAGFWGDSGLRISRAKGVSGSFALVVGVYFLWAHQYGKVAGSNGWVHWIQGVAGVAVCFLLARGLNWLFEKSKLLRVEIPLKLDFWISRTTEVLNSVPALLFIMAILAVLEHPSIYYIMLVIGLLRWTGIARLVRAELLRIRTLQYVEAARVLGLREVSILWKHALPNSLGPVWVALAFGMAGAVLVEASLSFLGIGLPVETVTWGSLMRQLPGANLRPWWLAAFPGLAIFMTVLAFNSLGESLSHAFRKGD